VSVSEGSETAPTYIDVPLEDARIVKVARDFVHEQDSFRGVPVDRSKSARLYLVVHDLLFANGVSMIRTGDVESEEDAPRAPFYRRVMQAKLDGAVPRAPRLDACTMRDFCRWLQATQISASFFEEAVEDAGCQVGRVARIGPGSVVLDVVDTAGEPDGEWEIPFRDLTRIDCLGEYERSFDLCRGRRN
jgi:hypothetical protein